MKISFIRPGMTSGPTTDALEPLVFALLASRTPPDVACALHDERVEALPEEEQTDLAAITVETFTARRAYQIADSYKQRGIPVVMGGHHPSMEPEEALRHSDAVVIGDGEGVWEQIVQDARAKRLQSVYRNAVFPSLAGPLPDRGIFQGKRYGPMALVQFGRGCRFACDFCSIHAFYGHQLRQRAVADVAQEVAGLRDRMIVFVDDNLFCDRQRFEELLRALIPLRVRWACQISVDIAANEHLMDLMAESGCVVALLGLESLEPANLRQMGKRWNLSTGDFSEVIRKFHRRGIMVYGTFVFGYDKDTAAAFTATAQFAIRTNLFLANFNPLTPMPGTRLYSRLQANRRLLYERWWLDPNYRYGDAIFRPQGMSPEELSEGCMRARREFYSYGSMARRGLGVLARQHSARSLGLFLLVNTVSRREIRRKQHSPLGNLSAPSVVGEAP